MAELVKRRPEDIKARLVVAGEMANDQVTQHCGTRSTDEALSAPVVLNTREVTKVRADLIQAAPGAPRNDGKLTEGARSRS